MEILNEMLPEGLPRGMTKEFEESLRNALLIRQSFLDLRDNFRWIVDPPMYSDGKGAGPPPSLIRSFQLCYLFITVMIHGV